MSKNTKKQVSPDDSVSTESDKTEGEKPAAKHVRKKLTPQKLGDKLRRIRVRHGLSQAQMLMVVNPFETALNRARVSQYEKGERSPSLVEIVNYANFADVSLETLLHDNKDLPQEYQNY